ncbi:protein brown-like isoform X3 [Leguminivora glycinivorella]|uniref:protein brown-like isoform X3 n=1 Tax=Leguminivora glycinivorella TaxID=1035111 RepID=UPI00200D5394|nr:protein brown-like isoform X3 [Leguminivora glycinivorella]
MDLLKRNGVDHFPGRELRLSVNNLNVWTPEEKSWLRRVTKPRTMILKDVTVCIDQGEFIAILGPSGAGKTTFLTAAAGKCRLPSTGSVAVNGTSVTALNGIAEIVPQFDVFMDGLTVAEHLIFMIEMKLGSYKTPSNILLLNTLLRELKLKPHVKTKISYLSGGQRRLLSLAGTLLSNPRIIICDEPTTGLDSYSAYLVISILRQLTESGRIVICSVHQPSSDLFSQFNNIMLMAEGRLLFHGTQEECRKMFERFQRNWFVQVYLLIWRSSLSLRRTIGSHLLQLLLNIGISAMIISTCYIGITGTTQRGVQDLRGFLWLLSSEVCYSLSYTALYVFHEDLTLFRREVGVYKGSAFFASRLLGFIPRCVVYPVAFMTIASVTVELPNRILTSLELVLSLICGGIAAAAYGLGMGALFSSSGVMGAVMPCVDLPLSLMSGAFLRIASLPAWLFPVKYVSHFYYTMESVSSIYWTQIGHIDCPSNMTSSCVNDGVSVLIEAGYSASYFLQDGMGLLALTIGWSIIGYYGLWREEKKGYAY